MNDATKRKLSELILELESGQRQEDAGLPPMADVRGHVAKRLRSIFKDEDPELTAKPASPPTDADIARAFGVKTSRGRG